MVIPDTFGTRGEKKVASYDYYDIVEGTGIKIFYGCGTTDSVGESHILTGTSLYSNPIYTDTDAITQTTFTIEKTFNFDLSPFNLSKIIKGTALIDGSFSVYRSAGDRGVEGYIVFTFQHFDGDSTYTDFGNVTTDTCGSIANGEKYKSFCVDCALTQKHFKIGESLRIRAQYYGRLGSTGSGSGKGRFAHDPKNRDSSPFVAATNHTSLNFHIPFKLDL